MPTYIRGRVSGDGVDGSPLRERSVEFGEARGWAMGSSGEDICQFVSDDGFVWETRY